MVKTKITELFGIEHPIIAGPMAFLSGAELVAAVSNAGGLGIIASLTFRNLDELREEIKKTKSLTDKPFAVNVTLLPTAQPVNYADYFQVAIEEGVTIVETSGRSPEPYMQMLKDANIKTMHRATRVRDVRTAERVGVDAVSIDGFAAAGHPGMDDVCTIVLVPAAVDAVNIPVIAAGGIADARGFVAALALGAEGVLMGTRFMASKECKINTKVKDWLLELKEMDTMIIMRSIRNAERVVRTEYTQKILEMEEKGATLEELLPMLSGLRGSNAYETGDVSQAVMTVGQVVGLVHDIPSVKEIIDGIVNEAKPILKRLQNTGMGG